MVMGSLNQEAEVAVVGAGPGGYVAALRAADLGKEVVLIDERKDLGGVCLLEGCIPSKALIHASELLEASREATRMGISFGEPTIDIAKLRSWRQSVSKGLSRGISSLLAARGVEVLRGRARFSGRNSLAIDSGDVAGVDFKHCILATGSSIVEVPFMKGLDLWTSREALELPSIPESLMVIGGGYIGLELGFVYAGLGAKVTVVELLPHLLAGADRDMVKVVQKRCKSRFEKVLLETEVKAIEKRSGKTKDAGFRVKLESKGEVSEMEVEQVLVAVGRRPNTADIGLDAAGITLNDRGLIEVDSTCRTENPSIFAIGDITPGPMLAHRASRQANVAAEVIAGEPSAYDNAACPAVVFTDPELAWAGLTENEAKAEGRKVKVGKFPLSALGRAKTLGTSDGFAKIISDPDSERILGVAVAGPHASELIAEGVLALEMGATLEDMKVTIHPHPTLSELLMEAAEVAAGSAVHVMPPKKK